MSSWEPTQPTQPTAPGGPTQPGGSDLSNTAKILGRTHSWALFLSILSFVGAAVGLVAALVSIGSIFLIADSGLSNAGFGLSALVLLIPNLAFSGILVVVGVFLFKFSRKARSFSLNLSVNDLDQSLDSLRNYFKLTAILTIAGFVFGIIIAGFAFLSMATSLDLRGSGPSTNEEYRPFDQSEGDHRFDPSQFDFAPN